MLSTGRCRAFSRSTDGRGAALTSAAFSTQQVGLIMMEGAWTVISVAGLIKVITR